MKNYAQRTPKGEAVIRIENGGARIEGLQDRGAYRNRFLNIIIGTRGEGHLSIGCAWDSV